MKTKPTLNLKFIARGAAVALPAAVVLTVLGFLALLRAGPLTIPLDPTPPPPVISAPRGDIPPDARGLGEYVHHRERGYGLAGSGFLLQLESGKQLGVGTAHCLPLNDPNPGWDAVAFRLPGQTENLIEFDTLFGPPGQVMDGVNLALDYALLAVEDPVDPGLFLSPDPRGGPQPGERVALLSGVRGEPGKRYELDGTVISTSDQAAWVLMDRKCLYAGLMSGSPIVSRHTGQVVGMVVAGTERQLELWPPGYSVLIGMHPIGSIVDKALAADSFPAIETYRR